MKNNNGDNIDTTKEHLHSPSNPDIGCIPESAPEYGQAAKLLSKETIESIASPTHLSPFQKYFLRVHYKLNHLPFTIMLWLAKMIILTRRFLKLRNYLPPCISCLFGQAYFRPWRQKSSAKSYGGVLCSSDINKPGQKVGTDQIFSAQPGLVPQEKGSMTRARIWGATVFVDYATRWVKVYTMQDTSGDSTLEAKEAFGLHYMTRNVLPKHHHANNGQFVENNFKQDCERKMQHLTFCGVGYHQQNGVSERIIKDLTLSLLTLVLHNQRYWP